MSSVLVFVETKDGKAKKASLEALSIGKKIATAAGVPLHAVAGGANAAGVAESAGKAGAEKLYVVADAQLDAYSYESYTAALKQVIDETKPQVVLIGGTSNGRDLAPRLAARLGVG